MAYQVKANPTFPASLTLVGQGRKQKLNLVFRHKTQDERDKLFDQLQASEKDVTDLLLELTESWDADVGLDRAGIEVLKQHQPGADLAILNGYGRAMQVELEKN